jgi:hypothetical protein
MSSELTTTQTTELSAISNTNFDIIGTLKSKQLITPHDIKLLSDAKEFAISSYTDVPQYRPMIVKLASVLNDAQFPTADSKFWQCKAETEVHFNELVRSVYKLEMTYVDVEQLEYEIQLLSETIQNDPKDSVSDRMNLKRLKIKKEQVEFEIKLAEKNIKYRIEEISDWYRIADKLTPSCKYSTTNNSEYKIEDLVKRLEYETRTQTDPDKKLKFQYQLDTLKRILSESVSK